MTTRAVLCGCGAMARGWLRALQSTPELQQAVEIVGLVDLDLPVAKALASEFNLGPVVIDADLSTVITAPKPISCLTSWCRQPVSRGCFRPPCGSVAMSCPKKPLAASMKEAKALLALAAETGRIHAVVQNRRFISGIRRLRRAVEDGLIGALTGIHCDFFIGPHFGGFREAMDNVLLLDMAIHTFDAARFVSGRQPLSVYCVETNPSGSWYAHGASANAFSSCR